ncbi:hypothetical protein E2C01_032607 [Portunus trituberculatus]|uniref:Uncharacterized protein n=1 Tax=Portunus trituberculatus TaxID=210409 RepID=A0A5B7F0V9_PORTR|nr:hypothetical protein [Portunus trituberculatus]
MLRWVARVLVVVVVVVTVMYFCVCVYRTERQGCSTLLHTSPTERNGPLTTPHSRTTYLYSRTTNSAHYPQTHAHTHAPRYAPPTHALQHYTHFHLPPTLHSTPRCTQGLATDT